MEQVIMVDEHDREIGTMEKITAHRKAVLHRAFSVFVFNKNGEMLMQQRAPGKYHSGGLWTNTCCSHPRPGEATLNAAQRRLNEEMGFDTTLHKAFDFTYKANFENGLTEYEFDHVFTGVFEGQVKPDPHEVSSFAWMPLPEIINDLQQHPEKYTTWFRIAFAKLVDWKKESNK